MTKILLPILLFITAVGLFFSYTHPAYQALQALQELDSRIDKALDDAQTLENKREQLDQTFANLPEEDMRRLMKMLPDSVDIVRTIIQLDRMAQQSGLTVDEFTLPDVVTANQQTSARSNAERESQVEALTFSLECSGPYDSLRSFLRAVETNLTIKDVAGLEVSTGNGNAGEVAIAYPSYEISLQTYRLLQ